MKSLPPPPPGHSHLPVVTALLLLTILPVPGPADAADVLSSVRVQELQSQISPLPSGFGWPITDRTAWESLAALPAFADVIKTAEGLLRKPLPDQGDDLFLDYSRTGDRDRWQNVAFERRGRIARFTLAECFENRGRFLPALEQAIAAICAERTWVYPAHDSRLNNFHGRATVPDLGAVFVAMELGEADFVLGDRLKAETRQLIREKVQHHVLGPFRAMVEGRQPEAFWLRARHNWNSVCLGSIAVAAMALEEKPQDRAFILAAAEKFVRYSLEGFTPDGYCSEGVGYWNYGFGHYILLAEAARQATHGKLDLMAEPAAAQPALFCVRSEIIHGIYPAIADVRPGTKPDPQLTGYVCRRFALNPPVCADKPLIGMNRGLAMTLMLSSLKEPLPTLSRVPVAESPLRSWFKDAGVLICRTQPGASRDFAAVLKGGNNGENHNHNDVGSFSVIAGDTMLLCDPGMEVYTARTFGAKRYESKVLNSFGHAVPVVAGQLQRAGADARATITKTDFSENTDTLGFDLRTAYAVRELQRLDRTFSFHRGSSPSLEVRDAVQFEASRLFESALITWGNWNRTAPDTLEFREGKDGVRVTIDTEGKPFEVRAETIDEKVTTSRKPVRIGIALTEPTTNAVVRFTIAPLAE